MVARFDNNDRLPTISFQLSRPRTPIHARSPPRRPRFETLQLYERIWTNLRNALLVALCILFSTSVIYLIIRLTLVSDDTAAVDRPPKEPPLDHMNAMQRVRMPLEFLASNGTLEARSPNGSWFGSSGYLHTNAAGDLVLYDVRNGTTQLLLPVHRDSYSVLSAQLSADGRYVVQEYKYSERTGYQNRFLSRFSNTDLAAHGIARLIDYSMGRLGQIDAVAFGPKGSQLVFVQMNNIYYKPNARQDQMSRAITSDGSAELSHGLCNWSYERDICAPGAPAMWFSPDGTRLAFLSFDDAFVLAHRAFHREPTGRMYDTGQSYPVSMAGLPGTHVQLTVANLGNERLPNRVVPRPKRLLDVSTNEAVIATVHWTQDSRLVSVWMNRQQNEAHVQTCSIHLACHTTAVIRTPNGWLRFEPPALFSRITDTSADLALIQPVQQPLGQGDLNQVVLYTLNGSKAVRPLQYGDATHAERIVHWDKGMNILFFLGNRLGRPHRRNLYAMHVNGSIGASSRIDCLTCQLHQRTGHEYHAHFGVTFNARSHYLLLESQGPSAPRHDVYEWLYKPQTSQVAIRSMKPMQTFQEERHRVSNVTMPLQGFERMQMRSGGVAHVKMLVPPQFTTCNVSDVRYPMLVRAYNGPGTFVGASTWNANWEWFMAVNRSVVVAMVDARGSGRMRLDKMYGVYGKLGWTEAEDLIETAQDLAKRFPCIDPARIGLYGYGYGGFATGMTMVSDRKDVFRCGAMWEPISDWGNTPALYAERYLGQMTYERYSNCSLIDQQEGLRNKMIFLVHGRTNMEYMMSKLLLDSLRRAGIRVEDLLMPDEANDPGAWRFYQYLNSFFDRCFMLYPNAESKWHRA